MLGGNGGGNGSQLIGGNGLNMDDSMAATNSSRPPYDTPERRPSIRMRQGGGGGGGGVGVGGMQGGGGGVGNAK